MSDAVTRALLPATSANVAAAKPVAPATTGDGGSRQAVLIPRPSPALQALQAGDIIEATINTSPPDGATRLATARYGIIVATWPNAPTPGTPVHLQVLNPGPPVKLQLLAPPPGQTALPGAAEKLPAASPLAAPRQPAAIQPGTILPGRLFPNAQPAWPGQTASPTASLPSQQLSVRVLALQPAQHGADGPPRATGDTLQATVQGSGSNHIRLQTEAGALTLRSNAVVPPGTKLTLQVLALPGTVLPPTTADRAARQISALAQGWPALEQSLQVLNVAAPEAAAAFRSTKLLQPGARLTSGIVFFLSAIRGGRIQDWLGADLVRTLSEHNRSTLNSQLADDFAQLARLGTEPVSSEWRTALLPFLHDGVLQQLRIYLRDRDHDRSPSGNDDDQGTRFVVEAELSRLGALQLDGLIRQHRFDLIIRSQQALPVAMCRNICDIFKKSGAEANFAGNISFQIEPDFQVAPLEQLAGHAIGVFA